MLARYFFQRLSFQRSFDALTAHSAATNYRCDCPSNIVEMVHTDQTEGFRLAAFTSGLPRRGRFCTRCNRVTSTASPRWYQALGGGSRSPDGVGPRVTITLNNDGQVLSNAIWYDGLLPFSRHGAHHLHLRR